ncbi:putative glycosyl transferase [Vibrio harveyi]|uniref:WecB/TagA/CpsF family glycosyltransferase n=1 Tax=Vibrio harveyi TaxID=669 RepID=UPI002AD8F91F|nr:WecB/TagA/CpsF family glycosyltransferase [Vibrio harveyi]CAK6712087.1 putative glycosyl transferase [Vibrio harveyi]
MKLANYEEYESLKKRLVKEDDCNFLVTFTNPFSYYLLKDLKLEDEFEHIFSDGVMLCILYRLFKKEKVDRISFDFSSIALDFLNFCLEKNIKVGFVGASQEEVDKSIVEINKKIRRGHISFYRNGYFISDEEKEAFYSEVRKNKIDVMIIGQGAPLQEITAVELRNNCPNLKLSITCGGFLSQSTNGDYYPKYISKLNLRWAYRVFKHEHVRKKFFGSYPKFLLRFFRESF